MSEVTKETRQALAERLRKVVGEIRRKPYPISDLIPLLTQAADELDIQCKPESKGTLYLGACITDETLYACVMRKEGDVTEFVANAKMDVRSLYSHDYIAKLTNSRSNLDSVRNNTTKTEEE